MREEIYIDAGNRYIKAASRSEDGVWRELIRSRTDDNKQFWAWLSEQEAADIYLCSVVSEITERFRDQPLLKKDREVQVVTPPSDRLDYETPETLGSDRFFVCHGAHSLSNGRVVVIDAGSACTVDFMSADGCFQGGVILPGLQRIMKAMPDGLRAFTGGQAVVPNRWPGKSSDEAIQWGTAGLFQDGLAASLTRYRDAYGTFELYLTGGDFKAVSTLLPVGIQYRAVPDLLLEGIWHYFRSQRG
ncbi:MAG: type III pantothenate kinase [Balneolaceae bacterium]